MLAVINNGKGLDHLSLEEISKPSTKPHEILVQLKAISLNPVDFKLITTNMMNYSFPRTVGLDGSGIIEECGEQVTSFKKGDRVFFHADILKQGVFSEYAALDASIVSLIPPEFSFQQAASLPCAGYTAYHTLYQKTNLQKAKTIFIQGISGGVGAFSALLAKKEGLKVIGSGSLKNKDWALKLGIDHFIDYNHQNWSDIIKIIAPDKIDLAILSQPLDKINLPNFYSSLSFNASIVSLSGYPQGFQLPDFLQSLNFHYITLGGAFVYKNKEAQRNLAFIGNNILKILSPEDISLVISKTITFKEIPNYLIKMSLGEHPAGKIVALI